MTMKNLKTNNSNELDQYVKKLIQIMIKNNLNPVDFSLKAGLPKNYIANMMNFKKRKPKIDDVIKIANTYNVKGQDLFDFRIKDKKGDYFFFNEILLPTMFEKNMGFEDLENVSGSNKGTFFAIQNGLIKTLITPYMASLAVALGVEPAKWFILIGNHKIQKENERKMQMQKN